ncbi:MAG: SLC13 family permease [Candidatus Binatia bacterium]
MDWQGWLTIALLALMLVAMAREVAGPDLVLMGGVILLAALGILTPAETFAGFSNEAPVTVGALLVLAAALRDTGAMEAVFGRILGRVRAEAVALMRLMVPIAAVSAFLNNTTIVAMMTPLVLDWSRRNRMSPGRFLIPLNYATILGGTVTIIGTTTNLLVAGLMTKAGMRGMGFFELAAVGVPVSIVGLAYLVLVGRLLLPQRRDPAEEFGERRREYTVAMIVEPHSPLVGQTIEEAGLRHLPGLFLVEIDRGGRMITPVGPDETIEKGDQMIFAGVVSTIVDLQKIRGLVPANDRAEPARTAPGRRLTEAVVSHSSPLVDRSIRDANFRTVYDAAVIAVHRNGERVGGKIGGIVLRPGDTLLLQTAPGFWRAHRNSPDFYLVSEIPETEAPRYDRAQVAIAVLLALIVVVTAGWLPISIAAFLAAGALVATRCISATAARRSVDWSILIVIGASIGVGTAMEKTGAAASLAGAIAVGSDRFGPLGALAAVYFATVLLTELITNNAAAALMFPIAIATATELGVEPRGFAMAVAVAASCGFASPFGYQTHLIVYGPGGYRFGDFVRVGLPLDVLCGVVAVAVIPLVWPF